MRIDKPDITNESQDYWEEVLESHRLGERQLGLQEVTEFLTDEELGINPPEEPNE